MDDALFVVPRFPLQKVRARHSRGATSKRAPSFSQQAAFRPRCKSMKVHIDQPSSSPSCRVETATGQVQHDSRPTVMSTPRHVRHMACALLPILTAAAQPALAEDAPASDPLSFIKGLQGNPLFDRILGYTVVVLLVYATIGAIIISIDGIIIKQNDARQKEWVRKRVEGDPYPKTMWQPEIDTKFPPKASTPSSKTGLNREQRRIEKKMQVKEEKEKKRREARAAARKKDGDAQ